MSVQVNTYVLCGVKLPFIKCEDDDAFEKIEPYLDSAFEGIHHHNGLCVIDDGMNGNYAFIGRVLAKTQNYEHFDEPVSTEISELEKELIASLVSAQFNIERPEVKVWVFSHYR
ncbi:hypothetical protein ACMZJR_002845 [Cronobacter turicensis]